MNPILISPQITSDKPILEQLQQMKSYLFRFKEEVELLLSNIDSDNLSEKFEDDFSKIVGSKIMGSKEMSQIIQSAGAIKLEVNELGGNVASLSVTTTGIYNQIYDPDVGILSELSVLGDSIAAAVKFGVDYTGFKMTPTKFAIKSTGTFTVDSQNFIIDSDGNVTVKGRIEASEGNIGALGIGTNGLMLGGQTALVKDGGRLFIGYSGRPTYMVGNSVGIADGVGSIILTSGTVTIDCDAIFQDDVEIGDSLVRRTLSYNGKVASWEDIDTIIGTGAYVLVGA